MPFYRDIVGSTWRLWQKPAACKHLNAVLKSRPALPHNRRMPPRRHSPPLSTSVPTTPWRLARVPRAIRVPLVRTLHACPFDRVPSLPPCIPTASCCRRVQGAAAARLRHALRQRALHLRHHAAPRVPQRAATGGRGPGRGPPGQRGARRGSEGQREAGPAGGTMGHIVGGGRYMVREHR